MRAPESIFEAKIEVKGRANDDESLSQLKSQLQVS
jgi:hypothetical protein